MLNTRMRATVVAIVVVMSVAGCATDPVSAPGPSVAPPSTSPTPSADPVPQAAVPAFGGDCDAALSASEVAEAMEVTTATFFDSSPSALTAGGLSCRWLFGQSDIGVLNVFPVEIVSSDIVARHGAPHCESPEDGVSICYATASTDDAWILVSRSELRETSTPPPGLSDAVDLVADRLDGAEIGPAERTSEWWGAPDCASLAVGLDLGRLLGDDFEPGYPGDGGAAVSTTLLRSAGFVQNCSWYGFPSGGDATVQLAFFPGAAARWADFAAELDGTASVAVDGADQSVVWSAPSKAGVTPSEGAFVSDGVNLLRVDLSGSATGAADLAERVLAAL